MNFLNLAFISEHVYESKLYNIFLYSEAFARLLCHIYPQKNSICLSFFLNFLNCRQVFVNGTNFFAFKIIHMVFFEEKKKTKTMKNIWKTDKNVEKCAIYGVANLYQ